MKKLLFTLAMLLSFGGVSLAQSWRGDVPQEGDYNHETVVYAKLTSNSPGGSYTVGAFVVEGTTLSCRASAIGEYLDPTGAGDPVYTLRVKGDVTGDMGKTIKFKVLDMSSYLEYTLSTTLTFDGESHGSPSSPIELRLNEPLSFTLMFYQAEMGQTYDLTDWLILSPEDATVPDNLSWAVYTSDYGDGSEYATIEGNTLTPLQKGDDLILHLVTSPAGGGVESRFSIVQYATGINLLQTSFTVERSDTYSPELTSFMTEGASYELLPAGSTGYVQWEVEDETILQWSDRGYFIPVKAGSTRVRPFIMKNDSTKIYANNNGGWITINVIVSVTGITIDPSIYGGTFKANVGDTHLYERLSKMITILPLDATDKSFTVSIDDTEAVNQTGLTTFTAVESGYARFTVTANGVAGNDPTGAPAAISEYIDLEVVAVPGVTLNNTTLGTYRLVDGNPVDITADVHDNVIITDPSPSINWSEQSVSVTGTSVSYENLVFDGSGLNGMFTAVSAGTTTVTINLRWPNYDDWGIGNTTSTVQYNTDVKSFNIVVTESSTLTGFDVAVTGAVVGQTGTITFTPQPAGADFDLANMRFNIQNGLSGQWLDQLTVTRKSATASKIVYEFTSTIPGMVSVEVLDVMGAPVNLIDPTSATTGAFTGFEIGYPVNFTAGWQWRSNPCGVVTASDFESIYTTANLEEIRTQRELLYNDPNWGFYGTLMNGSGLLQGQCYKLKMKSAQSSVLYGSSVAEATQIAGTVNPSGSITITLTPGWNWVGSPYFFNRLLNNVFTQKTAELEGAVIVGKNGSAELGLGSWQGDMSALGASRGYLLKNPTTSTIDIELPAETSMNPGDEGMAVGVKSSDLGNHVWKYDDTRFMNNMTMVCTFEDLDNAERYSVGAFVGAECRGEGILVEDKAFITVHCNAGEKVNFKLYDTWTGEVADVDETVVAQTRVGSLKAPFKLHADVQTTGISGINASGSQTESYDLAGRRISGQQPGVSLQRTKNGNFRKVVVK
ncbi:MAG: hypothetical protein IJV08_11585 [Bacteroidaceae bacterium]|nr:hypothetical protein [Bacteroidaceae bacterium]MBQ9560596.1 hypothetical protein [Bacteroidaceae bacterium]